ncbi:uncharacterized protein LOC122304190 [Carya illinoinensis]|uniref:uncharacterized protein LOC122304190 n=1 Tax=Carya illinoinensis TaxID=32201 RepID=UPI001C718119|nr:uncharacterized protein LOC122304190 [Carya illinoinensis]
MQSHLQAGGMSGTANYQGDRAGPSTRGGGRLRGFRARRHVPYSARHNRPRGAKISSYHSPEDCNQSSSDDSTQPPSPPPSTNPIPTPAPVREPSPVRAQSPMQDHARMEDPSVPQTGADAPTEPVVAQEQRKRIRGPARCIEFDKVRKHGKVLLKINEGETAPCCEHASMFTTRVSWIIKQYCDMSYARWTDVPLEMKEELIDRVRSDFVFDWERENHRLTVTKALRKRFNSFHHDLHKIYESFGSHEEALANGTSLVDPLVWVKLCGRWGSEEFKKISSQNRANRKKQAINHTSGRKSFVRILEQKRAENGNLVDFYKETRWSKKKNKFVTDATEETYKEMQGRLDGLEPEQRNDEAAATVFREVLGHRPGYARGLGEMVIPESSRQRDQVKMQCYMSEIERHKKDAEQHKKDAEEYKSQLDEMRSEMRALREHQLQTDRLLQEFFKDHPTFTESYRQTLGNDSPHP